MNRIATLLTTVLFLGTAAAQQDIDDPLVEEQPVRRYTVEVIVFSYEENVSVGSEIFLPDEPPPEEELLLDEDGNPIIADEGPAPVFSDDMTEAGDEVVEEEAPPAWAVVLPASTPASEDAGNSSPFELVLLPEEEFTLGDAARQFELLDAYKTMMHFGWTQPTFPEEETPAIELRLLAEPPEGLNGTLTLYLSRYLHLVVDLALDAPNEFETEVVDDDSFSASATPGNNMAMHSNPCPCGSVFRRTASSRMVSCVTSITRNSVFSQELRALRSPRKKTKTSSTRLRR